VISLVKRREALRARRLPALALALHDWLALGYLAIVGALVWLADGPARAGCLIRISASAAAVVVAAMTLRWLRTAAAWWRQHVYRAAVAAVVVEGYLMLRDLLPLVRPDSVDDHLLALDTALFGVTPSLWLEGLCNERVIIEWFSFCYFSYFFLCGGYIIAVLWLVRPGPHTAVFSIGSMSCMFLGHLGYLAVPGYGPIVHLAHAFEQPLAGGFFWGCVTATVQMGGAMKDIFPSLHTTLPTWFALFAWHAARTNRRWLGPAIVTSFLALNIIASTMILRWHYAVDVIAGLALALTVGLAAPRLAAAEARWRSALGWPGAWDAATGRAVADEGGRMGQRRAAPDRRTGT
jgi:membrane-associated phospholipid phosphatase